MYVEHLIHDKNIITNSIILLLKIILIWYKSSQIKHFVCKKYKKLLKNLYRKTASFTPPYVLPYCMGIRQSGLFDLANSTTKNKAIFVHRGPTDAVSKENFQTSMEEADKSTILIKYWSPKAYLSINLFLPVSKFGFPGTVTSYLSTSRLSTIHNFIHSFYSWF